ncbi:hypothetical protein [Haloplanus natans]|uniref:hypothetical protein n=1 Tax=Haloplanus natans TaxID=376171 RepID=UPI0012FB253C|nr:hypothetical protein [Haloplanus natans]
MTRQKARDPDRRMGIYTRLSDVPPRHRLSTYAERYDGWDVWTDFRESRSNAFDSTGYEQTFTKTARSWKAHMRERERHHALARPDDVETWCTNLAASRTTRTVYTQYWVRLEEFYTWLQFHADHPHRYHPVWMAAATTETAGRIWETKVGRCDTTTGSDGDA